MNDKIDGEFIENAIRHNINLITKAGNEKIRSLVERGCKILDVGGGDQPLMYATHILDIQRFPEDNQYRQGMMGGGEDSQRRFSKETWVQHDICNYPWPFKDNEFDFIWCTQTLEDIRDPIGACKEMTRVAKAGYINCPGKLAELSSPISAYLDADKYNGYWHHRWLVSKNEKDVLIFEPKHAFAFLGKWSDDKIKQVLRNNPELGSVELYWTDKVVGEEHMFLSAVAANNNIAQYIENIKNTYK